MLRSVVRVAKAARIPNVAAASVTSVTRPFGSSEVPLPVGPKSLNLIREEEKYAAHNYHPLPVVLAGGSGAKVTDPEGNVYFDYLSAYSAVNQGHLHPKIVDAMVNQLKNVALTSRAFYNDQLPGFSKFVCEYFGYERMLPMNTGAEAVETALKIARKFAYERRGVKADEAVIISACGCFHGRTMHAITMSCDPEAVANFGPLVPGHVKVLYNDLAHLEQRLKENQGRVAAFIVEPIQGEAGVVVPDPGYLTKAQELCRKYGALFIADEVQTGVARTGKRLAVDHESLKPDIVVLGKAVSGGLYPVSLVLTSADIMSVITPGTHGSTFGGNPVACAVAKAALEVARDENLAERAETLGQRFRSALQKEVEKKDSPLELVRGKGLLNAIVMKTDNSIDKSAWDLCLLMKARGVLAKPTHGNIIRLAPPLVISPQDLDKSVEIIASSVRDLRSIPRSQIPGAAPTHKQHKEQPCKRCTE